MRRRFQRAVARRERDLLSSVVAFELWYGVAKSQRKDANTQRLESFFAGPLERTLFGDGRRACRRHRSRRARGRRKADWRLRRPARWSGATTRRNPR